MNSTKTEKNKLQTINDLISALSEGERTTFNHIIHSINFKPSDFEKFTYWTEDCYTRNCLANNDKFELILICWCVNAKTPIHDHGGEECWVKVIDGSFKEVIYKKDENDTLQELKSSVSKENQVTYMKDFMGYHSLENVSNRRAMSLHLYAKPIRNCNIFDEESESFINKDMTYYTMF